jgi:acyl phosphate:glycerol-3-phosphate acyltransferase
MDWLPLVIAPLAGYLIGSIPFGYLVARARGVDIFAQGSGNIGATNVGRVLGKRFGVLVLVLDFAKGALPVLGARLLASPWPDWLAVLTGLAAFLGHLFPLYLGMRGGKGVATGTGVVAVLVPGPALAAFGVWIVSVLAWRYVSVASILAALALITVQLTAGTWRDPRTLFCVLAGALVIVKHRSNITRLFSGHENQIRETPTMTHLSKSLHVLAVGLWFGATVFFSFVVGLSLFGSFEQLGEHPQQRPDWFPPTAKYARSDDAINGPKEQGVRAAGFAVSPMFPWYFALQGSCGFVALATALPWARRGGVHRWRMSMLLTALTLVIAGWPVELYVNALRHPRNDKSDAYLQSPEPTETQRQDMQAARSAFGMWHGVSLMLNFAVILCVTGATALAAHLPGAAIPCPTPSRDATAPVPEAVAGS